METTFDLKNHKEKTIVDLDSYKNSLDNTLKSISQQFEINEKNVKEYSNKVLKAAEQIIKDESKTLMDRIEDVRIENGKYHLEAKKKSKELEESLAEANKLKLDLNKQWEVEFEKLKNYHGKKYDDVIRDIFKLEDEIKALNSQFNVKINIKILGD